jgi:two-component system response regulator DevR
MSIRILIVDDSEDMREIISELISFEEDMSVAAEAESESEAMAAVTAQVPDVALVDLTLKGGGSGVDLIRNIKSFYPQVRCILFSAYDDDQLKKMSDLAGADGFLNKMRLSEELPGIVRGTSVHLS